VTAVVRAVRLPEPNPAHRALDRRTPDQAYQARPKAIPTGAPIDAGHYRVRHDRIDNSGVITLGHNS
jgi:hypothetical protein